MSRRARTCQAALERKDLPRVRSCGVHTERGAPSRLPSLWLVPTKRSAVSDAYIPRQPGPPAPPPPAAPASWWRGISQTPSPEATASAKSQRTDYGGSSRQQQAGSYGQCDAPKSADCAYLGTESELLHTPRHVGSADPGTNTYLIMPPCDWNFEDRETLLPVMLVDTGDAREDYVPFLEQVLRGNLSMLDEGNGPVRLALTDMCVGFTYPESSRIGTMIMWVVYHLSSGC